MSVVSDNAPHKCPACGLVREWCPCPAWPETITTMDQLSAHVWEGQAREELLDAEDEEFAEIERQMG